MFPHTTLQLWVEVPVILVIGMILLIMAGKVGKLGPASFHTPRALSWLVWLYAGLAALEIWFCVNGGPLWSCALSLAFFGILGLFELSDPGFVLHENGIRWAQAVIYWSEIEGWAWIGNEQTLRVWTRTWSCRVNTFGLSAVVDTGLQRSPEAEALLERYIGDRKRSLP
jgi:hypothetical protein